MDIYVSKKVSYRTSIDILIDEKLPQASTVLILEKRHYEAFAVYYSLWPA
jgi:hypothetical protein